MINSIFCDFVEAPKGFSTIFIASLLFSFAVIFQECGKGGLNAESALLIKWYDSRCSLRVCSQILILLKNAVTHYYVFLNSRSYLFIHI